MGAVAHPAHGVDFHLAAPSDTLSNAFTTRESAWLDAVKTIRRSMTDMFDKAPTFLTATALNTLADQLRACGREAARIGPPTHRLQPAHTLLTQACARYDQGAQCFTTAADIGIPLAGSAANTRQTETITCGFASSEASITLSDAISKADQTRSQVN